MRSRSSLCISPAILLVLFISSTAAAQQDTWHFAVSGDSRNCGDVVMPAIARGVAADQASFYWHLGDFRAIYRFDQDYWQLHQPSDPKAMVITTYLANAWQDFIDNQLKPFGDIPVYLAFGNHELIPPMTREQLLSKFSTWLNAPAIRDQRLKDDPQDQTVKGFYHWLKDGVDFITLDNAASQFDEPQLRWIQALLARDQDDASVRAVIVGMHEALPESISKDHSMNQSLVGEQDGRTVYRWLLNFKQQSRKPVYVLASHSHYYMADIFNTEYWRAHGGVLPGWIIGTAGAERYELPGDTNPKNAKAHVYGYLLATVSASKENPIRFDFHELKESDVPQDVVSRFTSDFVHDCWVNNPVH
ncbi:MAG: metallophosphoesterase [Acidobacteriaceae bacterium]|nr:metallophosphoesterase [Acidobacteriaceae bacterium]